ncbi:hypothetical protein KKC1_34630, partial [Calderihabitans maritimus]
NPGF